MSLPLPERPRVLLIHNRYQQPGGEDVVFAQERDLLLAQGHAVEALEFTNDAVQGLAAQAQAALQIGYNPASARRVAEAIARFRPDVVHVHNWFMVASPSVLAVAQRLGVATVASLHNFRLVCANAQLLREGRPCELCLTHDFPWAGVRYGCYRGSRVQSALVGWATLSGRWAGTWRGVTRYITASAFARERLLASSLGLRPEQLVIKGNFAPDAGPPPEGPRQQSILYAGRLSHEKGAHLALELVRRRPDWHVTVVGSGELRAEAEALAATASNLSYHPQLERTALFALERAVDLVLVPSTWYENFPLMVAEAYAAGTPVVASDLGALRELVDEGQTGARFAPGDIDSLIAAVQRARGYGPQLGQTARRRYVAHYTTAANYAALLNIYREAIEAQAKAARA